ncbi:hypothetical protein J3R83DRAFT_2454, partial [Lanmaoa asiatica]
RRASRLETKSLADEKTSQHKRSTSDIPKPSKPHSRCPIDHPNPLRHLGKLK